MRDKSYPVVAADGQRRVSPKAVADLSNPAVRLSLRSFIEGLGRYPSAGAPDEYAALFEAAYPTPIHSDSHERAYRVDFSTRI
jgi:hypothetical protein